MPGTTFMHDTTIHYGEDHMYPIHKMDLHKWDVNCMPIIVWDAYTTWPLQWPIILRPTYVRCCGWNASSQRSVHVAVFHPQLQTYVRLGSTLAHGIKPFHLMDIFISSLVSWISSNFLPRYIVLQYWYAPICVCRVTTIFSVFEYCCMKVSHVIIVKCSAYCRPQQTMVVFEHCCPTS